MKKMKLLLLFAFLMVNNLKAQLITHVALGYDSKPNPTLSFGIGAKIKAFYATFDLRPDMNRKKSFTGNMYGGVNVGFDIISLFNDESNWKLIPEGGFYNGDIFMGAVKVTRQIIANEIYQYNLVYTVDAFIEPAYFGKSYQVMAGLLFILK